MNPTEKGGRRIIPTSQSNQMFVLKQKSSAYILLFDANIVGALSLLQKEIKYATFQYLTC